MEKLVGIALCVLLLVNVAAAQIKPTKTYVEEDPKANVTERYVALELEKTIGPELAEDVFLYEPHSLTVDLEGNLYIFDRSVKKIVKLDKNLQFVRAFGEKGQGPGEFAPGKTIVYINMGMDNKLYCNDTAARKMIVFDADGKYLGDYPTPGILFGPPTVDKEGQIYFFSGDDRRIVANNQKGEQVFSIPVKAKEAYSFLYRKQHLFKGSLDFFFMTSFTDPDHLLLYFGNSSTMLRMSKNKVAATYRVLPKNILPVYKNYIEKTIDEDKYSRMSLFTRVIPDGDVKGIYYLPYIADFDHDRSLLYQMDENNLPVP
jgi:hypothetical protein